jgi:hypothetical protein
LEPKHQVLASAEEQLREEREKIQKKRERLHEHEKVFVPRKKASAKKDFFGKKAKGLSATGAAATVPFAFNFAQDDVEAPAAAVATRPCAISSKLFEELD